MTLDNLLRIGKVKAHAADKVEIGRLLASVERALAAAGVPGLSAGTRLDAAYRALLQAALVAMLARGELSGPAARTRPRLLLPKREG